MLRYQLSKGRLRVESTATPGGKQFLESLRARRRDIFKGGRIAEVDQPYPGSIENGALYIARATGINHVVIGWAENVYESDVRERLAEYNAKRVRRTKPQRPIPKYQPGSLCVLNGDSVVSVWDGRVGAPVIIRRRFWAESAGGQPASWAYETNFYRGPGAGLTLFERFLSPASRL